MKKIILLLLFPLGVIAQQFETKVGQLMNRSEIETRFRLPNSGNRLRYASRLSGYSLFDTQHKLAYKGLGFKPQFGFEVGVFNDYINLTSSQLINSDIAAGDDQVVTIDGLVDMLDNFYLLYSVQDKAKRQETVYVRLLSRELTLGKPMTLATFERKKGVDSRLFFASSVDKKSFAIVQKTLDKAIGAQIEIHTFDQSFKALYHASMPLDKQQGYFQLGNVAISNDQNVYLHGSMNEKAYNVNYFTGIDPWATPVLFAYHAKKKETTRIPLAETGVKEYYDQQLFMTKEGALVIIFCYNARHGEAGYTLSHINDVTLSRDWKYSGLIAEKSKDAMNLFEFNRRYLDVVDFKKLSSGEYIFSLEINYRNRGKSLSDAIVLVGLDARGAAMWEKIIYKRHKIKDLREDHNSHRMVKTNNGVMVIYNDHAKNLKTPAGNTNVKTLRQISKALPVGVEVDAKGNMKKTALLQQQNLKGYTLDLTNLIRIDSIQHQFKLLRHGSFGKFAVAYGTIEIK